MCLMCITRFSNSVAKNKKRLIENTETTVCHHFKFVQTEVVFIFRIESWMAKSWHPCFKAALGENVTFLGFGLDFRGR